MTNDNLRQEAKRLYLDEHLTPAQIAERLGVSVNTVKSWKLRERWSAPAPAPAPAPEGTRAPAREPKPGTDPFQPRNQKATLHGLYARYLPEETKDIIQQMESREPADVLWDQIQLAYAALIRSQQIMHTENPEAMTAYMAAQAKTQSSINTMLRQHDELRRSGLVTEEQQARIENLRANTAKAQNEAEAASGSPIVTDAIWRSLMNDAYAAHLAATQPRQIFFGGSSSGKSFAILGQRAVRDIMTGKRNYLICRKVAGTIRRSAFNEIWKCITRMDLESEFERNKSEMIVTHKPTRCQILFSGLDDVEKVKSITPEKGVITDIIVEEATETDYDDYKQLDKRLRGDTGDNTVKRITLLFNPILQDHWIYTEFFAGKWDDSKDYYCDDDLLILRTTYKDNRWLTADDVRKLENETDKYYYDVYTLGKWGVLGNLIYTNWEIKDLSEIYKTSHQFHNGQDFGFFPDPAAFVRTSYNRAKKEVYIFLEEGGTDMTNDMLAETLKPIIRKEVLTCDSAEPKSIQELNNFGINAVPAVKGPDSLEFGIKWLQRQKIFIDPRCVNTILEFKKYKYQEDRNGRVLPKPVDRDNHYLDSLRYALESVMLETKVV